LEDVGQGWEVERQGRGMGGMRARLQDRRKERRPDKMIL